MIGSKIKERREALGLTQEELAKKMGYKSKSTINKIETGINDITQSKIMAFSKALNCSLAYLMDWNNVEPVDIGDTVQIPVYGRIPAGLPMEAIEDIEDYIDVPVSMRPNELIALKVVGSSMYPKYLDGDYVLIRKQSDCDSGQDCAVRVNGCDATLKKVVKEKDGIILQPINPEYEPKKYDYNDELNPVVIIGIVVELRRKI